MVGLGQILGLWKKALYGRGASLLMQLRFHPAVYIRGRAWQLKLHQHSIVTLESKCSTQVGTWSPAHRIHESDNTAAQRHVRFWYLENFVTF